MTGIFRANNPLNASILFVYGLLLKLPYFLSGEVVHQQLSDGFLFKDIFTWISPALHAWPPLAAIIAYLLLFTQAVTINYYINSRKMVAKPNYLTAMAYLLITSFFPSWNMLSATLLVNTLILWILGKMLILGSTQHVKAILYNIGFLIGICSFLYLPSVTLLFLLILSLIIFRAPRIAEWGMVFLGFITTWYFLAAWLFLTNKLYSFYIEGLQFDLPDIPFTPLVYIRLSIILLVFFVGSYFIQAESGKQIIQVRKRWTALLAGAVVLLITPFLSDNENLSDWVIALLFIAPFAGMAFYYIRSKWIRLILHWGMVGVIVYFQYFT